MATVHIDSFDNLNDTVLPGAFDSFFSDGTSETSHGEFTISVDYGRDHSSGLRMLTGGYLTDRRARIFECVNHLTSCILGVAFYMESAGQGAISRESYQRVPIPIITFLDGLAPQISIVIDGAMRLRIYNGGTAGTLITTSTAALHENVWHYIAIDLDIANIIGAITVKLDGKSIITQVAIDTQSTANQQITAVTLGGTEDYDPFNYAGYYVRFDDFYLFDKNGGVNNAIIGDVQVKGLLPASDGPTHAWSPSTGTLHYDMIDDSVPPFMTNSIAANNIGDIDVFRYGTISIAAGTIHALSLQPYVNKSNSIITAIGGVVSDGATYSVGSNLYLSTDGQYLKSNIDANPIAGGRFTLAQLAAYYFGVKRTV